MNTRKYISLARNQAENSTLTDWLIGAVIVKGNKIVGKGYNKYSGKVSGFEKKYNMNLWSLHAEMNALLNTSIDNLSGAVLFVAGRKKNGNPVNSRPCNKCLKILSKTNIKKIYYDNKGVIECILIGD